MTGTIRRNGKLLGLLGGLGALAAVSGNAQATPATVFQFRDGYDLGPQGEDTGPGAEQMHTSWLEKGGDVYVVTVWMSSEDYEPNTPWQGACSSMKLTKDGLPEMVVNNKQITDFSGGDRVANHIRILAAQDMGSILFAYGSDKNGNNTPRTYVRTIDENCNLSENEIQISQYNDDNCGAPDIAYHGAGNFTVGYLRTANNDTAYAVGVHMNADLSLEKTWHSAVVSPSNIGRPAMMDHSATELFFCAAKGDNRPPEDGVQCAMVDALNGDVLWKQYLEESDPGNKYYANQPSIAKLDNGRYAVQVLISSGEGKTDNDKGSAVSKIKVIETNSTGFITKDVADGLGSYQTHSSICGGMYGEDGSLSFGIFGASITGNGQPVLQMGTYSPERGIEADNQADKWIIGWYGDSGYLANEYGENPNNQGREFLFCRGDLPNPAFGNPAGFMPDVETFFTVPHAGRVDGEPKNSAWFSLVPGKTNTKLPPEPPQSVDDAKLGEEGQGDTGTGSGTDTGGGEGGGSTGSNNNPNDGGDFGNTSSGGCACTAAGSDSDSTPGVAGMFALLGLAFTFMSRRRKES